MADAKHFRHISDIDVWLTPDRNYFVFILLSVFCGFFALDHFYLRSFDSAAQKLAYNFFGLGIWYFWDLIQIFTENTKVRNEGLSSPFDWTQGIGRGVFAAPGQESGTAPQKSYILWAFLAIFGGFFALDKFYLGETNHAIVKLVSVFSGILTLFGVFWVAWDAAHAFFMTKSVLSDKISLPFPLTYLGFEETSGAVFLPGGTQTEGGGWFDWWPFKAGNSKFFGAISGKGPDVVKAAIRLVTVGPIIDGISSLKETVETAAAERAAMKGMPSAFAPLSLSPSVSLPSNPLAGAAAPSLPSLSSIGAALPTAVPTVPGTA
jgi:TM2 domain-containing membrane protein YozV